MTPDLRKRGRALPTAHWIVESVRGFDDVFTCDRPGTLTRCGIWHRTEGAAKRHCEQLNRKEARSR